MTGARVTTKRKKKAGKAMAIVRDDETQDNTLPLFDVKGMDFNDLTNDVSGGMWDEEIKAFMDGATLKGLFFHEDWVFIVLDILADHVSMSPLKVCKRSVKGGKEYIDEVAEHPVAVRLENPNSFQEYQSWMYNYVIEFDLMGNTIMWRARTTGELMILPAEAISMQFAARNGRLSQYILSSVGAYAGNDKLNGMAFSPDDIWHHRRPNPASLMWGLSPFIPNRKSILFSRYTQDYLNAFYLKGATPGLALKMEKNVAEDSAMRFLRSFEMAHTGRRNMRRTLMLPKGVDVKTITPNIGDQKLVEMINNNREKILNILRVPKHALSLAESGSLGSEEAKQALKFFYTSAIIPHQKKIAAYLTRQFRMVGELKPNEFLHFDNGHVEALKEDQLTKAQLGAALREQWTLNEIRQVVHDMEPIEGGDAYPGSAGKSTQPDKPNSGTTDDPTEGDEEEEEGEDEEDEAEKMLRETNAKIIGEAYGPALEASHKAMDEEVETVGAEHVELWLDALLAMAAKAIPIVRRELESLPKREKADDDKPSKKPRKAVLRAKLDAAFEGGADAVAEKYTKELFGSVERGYDLGVNTVFNAEAREEVIALGAKDVEGRRLLLLARGLDAYAHVSSDTAERILAVIEEGVKKKRTIKEITAAVAGKFSEIGQSRAEAIARTEVLTAVSIGKAAAMKNASKVIDDLVKVWIDAGDRRVRGHPQSGYHSKGNHYRLNGEIVKFDEPFSNGLQYPRDVKSRKKAEIVNCRCDFLVVSSRDLGKLNIPTH